MVKKYLLKLGKWINVSALIALTALIIGINTGTENKTVMFRGCPMVTFELLKNDKGSPVIYLRVDCKDENLVWRAPLHCVNYLVMIPDNKVA